MPRRKSSVCPALTCAASRGSNAACTAWNSRIGMRERNRPTMKSATAVRSPGVASSWAPRNGA